MLKKLYGRSFWLSLILFLQIFQYQHAYAEPSWVALTFRQVSGIRPFVSVKLNDEEFLFMVHANAGFYAMTNHANAAKAGIADVIADAPFGVDAPGHVSSLGKGHGVLSTLKVGNDVTRDVPLSVFEVIQDVEMQGMLGIKWLRSKAVILDYGNGRMGIPSSREDSNKLRRQLESKGYRAHRIEWDSAQQRYIVKAQMNGQNAAFVLSTVSHLTIDTEMAERARISLTPAVDQYAGPTGATGFQYQNASPLRLTIDGQVATVPAADVHDIYAYDGESRPSLDQRLAGYLGCELLLLNSAVIDFGADLLYLKP